MDLSKEFRCCLEDLDIPTMRRLWKFVQPNLPQPTSDRETLVAIHIARTQASSIKERLRFYSHRWLLDEGYPSMLPDKLKPRAEREYPQIVEGVGIAVRGLSPLSQSVAPIIRRAMEDVVLDAYAGTSSVNPVKLKKHMMDARSCAYKKFLG